MTKKTADVQDLMPLKQDLEAISAAMLNANDHITELLVKLNEMTGETPEEEMGPPPEETPEAGPEEMPETEENVEEAIGQQEEEAGAPEEEGGKKSSRNSSKEKVAQIESQISRLLPRLPVGYVWHVGGGVAGIIKRLDANRQFSIKRAPTNRISFLVSRNK